jgi:hypothetical protein
MFTACLLSGYRGHKVAKLAAFWPILIIMAFYVLTFKKTFRHGRFYKWANRAFDMDGTVLVKELIELVSKQIPIGNEHIDWNEVEKHFGLAFPPDYKEFINSFGCIGINEFYYLFSPTTESKNLNLITQVPLVNDGYFTSKDEFPEDFICDYYPTLPGLLPFCVTSNGDYLFFKADPNHTSWPIIIGSRGGESEVIDTGMMFSEFFLCLFKGMVETYIHDHDDFFANGIEIVKY